MANPEKQYHYKLKCAWEWMNAGEDQIFFVNYIQVGKRIYQMEGILIEVA